MADGMQADLVERARLGDQVAFEQIAERNVDRLLAIAGLILRDHDLAEDATQEALIRCWRQLPKLRDVEKFDGWLYRILVRAAIDESKRRPRLAANIDLAYVEPAIDSIAVIADREQLERGFRRLSINHRAVVVLRHYVGLPLKEVATTLGIPEGTARSRYHFAMSALRAALEAESRLDIKREVLS
jgi:RNA polymerase sigma-70 factor (ECF subfamily)